MRPPGQIATRQPPLAARPPFPSRRDRTNVSRRKVAPDRAGAQAGVSWPVLLFILALGIPWILPLGPLRMSAYRLVLIAMLLPCIANWLRGGAGQVRAADVALLVFCFWCCLSIVMIHGVAASLEPSGIIFLETMGAYLLARCMIRDADDFLALVRLLFRLVLVLAPFAIFESVTGRNVLLEMFAAVTQTSPDVYMDPRWGLRRVHAVFEHPILFGVIVGGVFALTHLVLGYGKKPFVRWLSTGAVGMTAFLSLSAGPITALTGQGALMAWNILLAGVEARWKILVGFVGLAFVAAELLTNRSLPVIFISHFAFDEESAWVRIAIWRYGSESVLSHPLFGIGFHEWARPPWMTSSIDMFWIVDAVRHGLVASAALMFAFFSICLTVAFKRGLDDRTESYRTGFLIAMTGYFLVGWTVYFWNTAYVLFIFMLGSGVWFLDVPAAPGGRRASTAIRQRPNV